MSTSEHFNCHYCKDSLLGKKYIMKEDTQYCTKCYENLFANCCGGCSLPIGCNSKVRKFYPESNISAVSQVCSFVYIFLSMQVPKSLFLRYRKNNQNIVFVQDLSYKDRHWHEQCFKCAKCSRSLVEKAFAVKDDLLLCTECYANDYSSKCATCKKTVMPGCMD